MGSEIEKLIRPNGDVIWNNRKYGIFEKDAIQFFGWKNGENELKIQIERIQSCSIERDLLKIEVEGHRTYLYEGDKVDVPAPQIVTVRRGLPLNDLKAYILSRAPNITQYVYTDILQHEEKFIDMSFFGDDDKRIISTSEDDGVTELRLWVENESFNTYTTMENGYPRPINGGPITPNEKDARSILNNLAKNNRRNFFIERIEQFISKVEFEKKTGGPIMEHPEYDLFDRVGIQAPELNNKDHERKYTRGLFRWILCQGIELQLNPDDTKIDIAIVLEGPQYCGKSTLCQMLFKGFFTDQANLDSAKTFIETTGGVVGIEIQEVLKELTKKRTPYLKSLISMHKPNIRVAYGRGAKFYKMRAVMIFTTNDPQPLTDITGNRRFAPIHKIRTESTEDPKKISDDDYLGYWAKMYKEIQEEGTTSEKIYNEEILPYKGMMVANFEDNPIYYTYLEEVLNQYPNIGDKVPTIVIKDGLTDGKEEVTFGLKRYRDYGYMKDSDMENVLNDFKTNPEKWGFRILDRTNPTKNTTYGIKSSNSIEVHRKTARGWWVRIRSQEVDEP